MGLELICERCRAPMCAFKHRVSADGSVQRVCVHCCRIERDASADVPERVYRALGVLAAQHRMGGPLIRKTRALIQHDRILRGEA